MNGIFGRLSPLTRALDYHLARHGVLSANVANADTPGYRPSDVSFDAVLASEDGLRVPDPEAPERAEGMSIKNHLFDDTTIKPGPNGNAVSVDRELAKISANSIRYKAVVEMLNRRLALIRYAASDGQRR